MPRPAHTHSQTRWQAYAHVVHTSELTHANYTGASCMVQWYHVWCSLATERLFTWKTPCNRISHPHTSSTLACTLACTHPHTHLHPPTPTHTHPPRPPHPPHPTHKNRPKWRPITWRGGPARDLRPSFADWTSTLCSVTTLRCRLCWDLPRGCTRIKLKILGLCILCVILRICLCVCVCVCECVRERVQVCLGCGLDGPS